MKLTAIARLDSSTPNVTFLLVLDNTVNDTVILKFNGTDQLVNSSFCNISSLEVYRGRQLAIEIGHAYGGFSLSNNSNIEVNL